MGKTIYIKDFTSDKLELLLSGFRSHIVETDRSSSAKSYLSDIKRFANWQKDEYGSFSAAAVTPLDIKDYREHMQKNGGRSGDGAKPATANRALVSLKIFFDWLVKNGEVIDNPALGIKPVAVAGTPSPKWLSRNEQHSILRKVRESGKPRDYAIIGIMLYAGLRVSEVCALSQKDMEIRERKGKVIVRQGKGNKYREVPLNSDIRKIMAKWLEVNQEGPLFPNSKGKPISVRGIFHLVELYAKKADLMGEVTPHTFRHTFCKNLIDEGVPIDQVAMLAGHSSLDITKRYTAPSMADLQAAVERAAWGVKY